jgi:nucleoside diphosphate kinase
MVWQGKGVVKAGRVLLGETNPLASLPGTIRGGMFIVSFLIGSFSTLSSLYPFSLIDI